MKPAKLTVDEALRVVGHLLAHHPTTGAAARDVLGEELAVVTDPEACAWCITGAAVFVFRGLGLRSGLGGFEARMAEVLGEFRDWAGHWDASPEWRREAVEKLKRAGLSTEA